MFTDFTKDEIHEHVAAALIHLRGGRPDSDYGKATPDQIGQAQAEASIALTMALTDFMHAIDLSRCGHGTPELLHPCPDCEMVRRNR